MVAPRLSPGPVPCVRVGRAVRRTWRARDRDRDPCELALAGCVAASGASGRSANRAHSRDRWSARPDGVGRRALPLRVAVARVHAGLDVSKRRRRARPPRRRSVLHREWLLPLSPARRDGAQNARATPLLSAAVFAAPAGVLSRARAQHRLTPTCRPAALAAYAAREPDPAVRLAPSE